MGNKEKECEEDGTPYADVVKGLHKSLRVKIKEGFSPEQVWSELLKDRQCLDAYSHSMFMLAKNHWQKGSSSCRVTWCYQVCQNYFNEGGILKAIKKEEKTKRFNELRQLRLEEDTNASNEICSSIDKLNLEMFWRRSFESEKLILLDVGSCFNPFKEFDEFTVVAVDISPATNDVIFCDFLNLDFGKVETVLQCNNSKLLSCDADTIMRSVENNIKKGVAVHCFFDVVVFSLLLSYFPTASQRFKCCINAHKALKMQGLLLIITPDSSHQNRHTAMMKSWNTALNAVGFCRYKYEKLQHLHCMAFRKSSELPCEFDFELGKLMYIPQDSNEIEVHYEDGGEFTETSGEIPVYDTDVFANMDMF